MSGNRVERRLVYSRPQWASFQANGGVPKSPPLSSSQPPASANHRPVLNPAQVCDLVCKVVTTLLDIVNSQLLYLKLISKLINELKTNSIGKNLFYSV